LKSELASPAPTGIADLVPTLNLKLNNYGHVEGQGYSVGQEERYVPRDYPAASSPGKRSGEWCATPGQLGVADSQ